MSKNDIVKKVLDISTNSSFLDYNIAEFGDNDIIQDSRLNTFTIIHKVDEEGIVIEYIKGKIYISFFFNPRLKNSIGYSDIIAKLPLRFKEVLANIRKLGNTPISTSCLKDLFILSIKGVPKNKLAYLDYIDSKYSTLLFTISELLKDKKKHTYLYIDKPLFGKINRHFRASTKEGLVSIREIIDIEK